jgi:cell shape-determining protein MreD
MKGFRTLFLNAGMAALLAMLHFFTTVNWTAYVDPTWAIIITNAVNILLRFMTNTPVMNKD